MEAAGTTSPSQTTRRSSMSICVTLYRSWSKKVERRSRHQATCRVCADMCLAPLSIQVASAQSPSLTPNSTNDLLLPCHIVCYAASSAPFLCTRLQADASSGRQHFFISSSIYLIIPPTSQHLHLSLTIPVRGFYVHRLGYAQTYVSP